MEEEADDAIRHARLTQAVDMLQGVEATQTCVESKENGNGKMNSNSHGDGIDVCAGSKSLSQRLSFTLLNDQGNEMEEAAQDWQWDFHSIKEVYLSNSLRLLSPYVSLSIDSTVQHYGHLTDVEAIKLNTVELDQDDAANMLHAKEQFNTLPTLVQEKMTLHTHHTQTRTATPTSTPSPSRHSVHQLPVVALTNLVGTVGEWNKQSPLVEASMELIAYIPPKKRRPLIFNMHQDHKQKVIPVTSLFVPRFGGVAIINDPGSCMPSSGANMTQSHDSPQRCTLNAHAISAFMQTAIQHIRHSLALHQRIDMCPSCVLLPSPLNGMTAWELDLLASRIVRRNLAQSLSTLHSLYALLDSVPHMPLSDDIVDLIQASVNARTATLDAMYESNWTLAGCASQSAVRSAHRAFFHPDMLPALYFADEHVYAVYAPLFMPIILPMMLAMAQRYSERRKRNKTNKDTKQD